MDNSGANITNDSGSRLTPLEAGVIELFVQYSRALRLPRSVAEIYGLLFVSHLPLSQPELEKRLQISVGSTCMLVLVWVAAHYGISAIAQWHDPTGVTILLACFFALWGLGTLLARKPIPVSAPANALISTVFPQPKYRLVPLLLSLLAWLTVVEISAETWYRWHERHLPPAATWTVSWPTDNPSFKERPLEESSLGLLQCDESRRAGWPENNLQWETIFIKWNPGTRVQVGHSPKICMTAAGHTLTTISNCAWFAAGGLRLPFTVYQMMDAPQPFYLFYCLWNDRLSAAGSGSTFLRLSSNRLAPVLTGLRDSGQRSLEIAVTGNLGAHQAQAAFQNQLSKIIQSEPASMPAGGLK